MSEPSNQNEKKEETKNNKELEINPNLYIEDDLYEKSFNPEVTLKFPKVTKTKVEEGENLIGSKIELNDQTATIKYVGPLMHKKEVNKNDIWIGVEWDDKTRGKHNGTVEGYEYFKTNNNLNSGSLIRISKPNFGQNFIDALNYKYNFYGSQGNDFNKFVDQGLEMDNFIQTNKKIINIELVGKEKAVKEFSEFKRMICIDLTNSYVRDLGNNLSDLIPRVQELQLTKTLLTKWTEILNLLTLLPRLTMLNFSENILEFDDKFDEEIKKFSSGEKKLRLNSLVLNKCGLELYSLIKLCPIFINLESLYLMGNLINNEIYEKSEQKEFIDKNIEEIHKNIPKLKYLSLEKNRIQQFFFGYKIFKSPVLKYINLNQNLIQKIFSKEEWETKLIDDFKSTISHISIDYNMFPEKDFNQIMIDIEKLSLKNIDILNNMLVDKNGQETAKIELIGRNPNLSVLNKSIVTKILRRDYEKFYLKKSVESYFKMYLNKNEKIDESNFNLKEFEQYMKENHSQYFVLRKRYFDPIDDFINLTKVSTNTIKGNLIEVNLVYNDQIKKKKFPKTTTLSNLRNLCTKLFKMENDGFSYYIKNGNEDESLIEDETLSLLSLNLPENHKIILK